MKFMTEKKTIYNLKIQGQVCRKTPNSLLCEKNKKPSCGQSYIYEDLTSIEKKLETNENLIRDHIKIITDVMPHNPIAKNHKHLHQLSYIQNIPNYKMYFIRKNDKQRHTYNKPIIPECGAIIVSNSDIIDDYDLCIVTEGTVR